MDEKMNHPGKALRDWRKERKILTGALSSCLGTSVVFISDLERGVKGLKGRDAAVTQLVLYGVPPEIVLALQEVDDCQHTEKTYRPVTIRREDGTRERTMALFCADCFKCLEVEG